MYNYFLQYSEIKMLITLTMGNRTGIPIFKCIDILYILYKKKTPINVKTPQKFEKQLKNVNLNTVQGYIVNKKVDLLNNII